MQTIVIKLNSRKLENPVTYIPYVLSENVVSDIEDNAVMYRKR